MTDYKPRYSSVPWMVELYPDGVNNLSKRSVIDLFQLRSVSQVGLFRSLGKVRDVLNKYKDGKKIHIVPDSLNRHFRSSFEEVFGKDESDALLSRVEFHHTPKHASWLNIAEIEINVMDMECTDRRFESYNDLKRQVKAWTEKRNRDITGIEWKFNRGKSVKKLSKYYTI